MKNSIFKIGIYVRVSTEEQAENPEGSIKNQAERLKEFVKLKQMVSPFGEVVETFVDAGISAKDMNRPALQRLLAQIQRKEVNLVLVTELSRFTRSIKDFSVLWEYLEKHQCKFMSIKDNFDTSTAAGEMVMYMMATIAQFERKQTAERISYSFLARAKRGLHNGGAIPLGYEVDKTKSGSFAIIPDEAEIVRLVFKTFLTEGTLASTAKKLNELNIKLPQSRTGKPRVGIVRMGFVHNILRNKAYLGLRVFNTKEGNTEVVKAIWEPIVNEAVFEKAQILLIQNRFRKRSYLHLRYPYTLSGITFCKCCGERMSGKSSHGRTGKVPYYEHARATKHQASLSKKMEKCDPYRIRAEKIEPVIWREVKRLLTEPDAINQVLDIAKAKEPVNERALEREKTKKKIASTQVQMEALVERISRLPKGVDESLFLKQLEKLQEVKKSSEERLEGLIPEVQVDEVIPYGDFVKFTAHFKKLVAKADKDPEIQTEIIRKLVHKIEITAKGIEIAFHVGKHRIEWELGDNSPSPRSVSLRSQPLPKYFKESGSRSLLIGGGAGNRTPVRKCSAIGRYILSQRFKLDLPASTDKIRQVLPSVYLGRSPEEISFQPWLLSCDRPWIRNHNPGDRLHAIKLREVGNRCQLQFVRFYRGPRTIPGMLPMFHYPRRSQIAPTRVCRSRYLRLVVKHNNTIFTCRFIKFFSGLLVGIS